MSVLAITGGTGFVGARVIEAALTSGHRVRALARKRQEPREGITWIYAALDSPDALRRLLEGVDAIIHVAGIVNAPTRAAFAYNNIDGTRTMIEATTAHGVARFIHVSSLAAREPQLSSYGWSKAEAEAIVEASDTAWTIVRPPAIYGPGDLDQLDVFKMAKLGIALLPPPGRLSVIAVDDLAQLLLALATIDGHRTIYEADDGTPGYSHADYARMIGQSVGCRVLPLPLPRAFLSLGARLDQAIRGDKAKLTVDRVAYFSHPDWTIDPSRRPPRALWTPAIPTSAGLKATAAWYRARGLL